MPHNSDPFSSFKDAQRESWNHFYHLENVTIPAAAKLVDFAGIEAGQKLLDVACGTGIVAVTAALRGATVSGLDLAPVLIEKAKINAEIAGVEIAFREGDAEVLPYADATFDVVLSQFGHMFAPRPELALSEMLRVLKPGGRIAFSTWLPGSFVAKTFALRADFAPAPHGAADPIQWGDTTVIEKLFAGRVKDLRYEWHLNTPAFLSPRHALRIFESTFTPLVSKLSQENTSRLAEFRSRYEKLIASYMRNNTVEQQFIMTRAFKI